MLRISPTSNALALIFILTVIVGISHDRTRYTQRTFLYIGQRWIKVSAVQIGFRYQVGQSCCGNKESLFGNCAHTGAYCGQRDSREYVTIVTLARIISLVVVCHWRERRAACKYASSLRNSNDWIIWKPLKFHTRYIHISIKIRQFSKSSRSLFLK